MNTTSVRTRAARKSQEHAVDRYIHHLENARESMERISEYLADFGEVSPNDVTWANVGSMDAFAKTLKDLQDRIDQTGEYAPENTWGGKYGVNVNRRMRKA